MNAQTQALIPMLESVAKAYAAAHEGTQAPTAEQLTPYATTPEQQSTLQKLIALQKDRTSFVSPTRHLIPQSANTRN